jgi:type I restriction enzyme M protein
VINPQLGETLYDPCCGTAGFMAESYGYMVEQAGDELTPEQSEILKHRNSGKADKY